MNCNILSNEYSTNSGLMNDVNVLDLSRILAGPFCTMTLGDLGANVIKVESLDGDEARKWGLPFINGNKDSIYFVFCNRNKKVFALISRHKKEPRVAVITLRAPRAEQRKKVVWTEDTVDNEHMNKKKSKCCCIYEKPHKFGDSDSEDSDDECEHCSGHVEKRKAKKAGAQQTTEASQPATLTIQEEPQPPVQTATVTLQPSEPVPAPAPPDRDGDIAQCAV